MDNSNNNGFNHNFSNNASGTNNNNRPKKTANRRINRNNGSSTSRTQSGLVPERLDLRQRNNKRKDEVKNTKQRLDLGWMNKRISIGKNKDIPVKKLFHRQMRTECPMSERETIAEQQLGDDFKFVIDYISKLLDRLTQKEFEIIEELLSKSNYEDELQSQLYDLDHKIIQQLARMEKDISSKF